MTKAQTELTLPMKGAANKRIRVLFWLEVAVCAVTAILCTIALLLPTRPVFVWLPAVVLLMAVLAVLSLLLSLDRGVQFGNRTPVVVYATGRLMVTVLTVLVLVLLCVGFATKQTYLPAAIPLTLAALISLLCGCAASFVSVGYARSMPEAGFDPARDQRRPGGAALMNGNGARLNGNNNDTGKSGVQSVPMTEYAYDRDGGVHVTTPNSPNQTEPPFKGSQHTVFTMASDV